jgi:HEAT repeat protein
VPVLVDAFRDDDSRVRLAVVVAIRSIGPDAKTAVPVLVEALKDEDFRVRVTAVGALGEMGPAATAAVPALRALGEQNLLKAAADALGKIEPTAKGTGSAETP